MSTPSTFEQSLNDYRERLSNVKSEEVADLAKRIAESDEPLEELKQVVGEVTTPLALDFLKEGIMHRMGVSSAQIVGKNGKIELKQALEKEFNKRLGQLKDKAKGAIEDAQQKAKDAISAAKESAKSTANDAQASARAAVSDAQKQASDIVAEGQRKAAQAVSDAQDQASATVQSAKDAATDAKVAARNTLRQANSAEDADAARKGFKAPEDQELDTRINSLPNLEDSGEAGTEANSINRALQNKFNQAFPADDPERAQALENFKSSFRDEYDGPTPEFSDAGKVTNFDAEDAADFLNYKADMYNDAIGRKVAGIKQPDGYDGDGMPKFDEPTAPTTSAAPAPSADDTLFPKADVGEDDPFAGPVSQRIAQAEAQQVQLRAGQQLPTAGQGAPKPSADTTVTPEDAPKLPTPPKPSAGAGAEGAEGAEGADAAAGAAAGAEGGLEGTEAALLASGPETGGLGTIIGGLVGIGAALASIFAGHKEQPKAPQPQLAQSLSAVGIRG